MNTVIELQALLADPDQAGAYFVDADGREALVEATQALGFALLPVELAGCRDKDDALARIAAALAFPDWFGGNWDALADCLADLSWQPANGRVLLLDNAGNWRDAQADAFATLLQILDETAQAWARERKPFWALLPLPASRFAEVPE